MVGEKVKSRSIFSRRTPQERFLRFVLRRKPCTLLLPIEFLILIILFSLMLSIYHIIKKETEAIELTHIEKKWKEIGELKLNFHQCEYEPIWERPQQMNYDLCKDHYGKGAAIWALQRTLTNLSTCIHKIHTVPCHSILSENDANKRYETQRLAPKSCGGLFGALMPPQYITSEQDVRAPQVTNEMLQRHYMYKLALSSALQIKCPRCSIRSGWYAAPNKFRCRRQLKTVRYGWPYIAKFCDVEEETDIDVPNMIYC